MLIRKRLQRHAARLLSSTALKHTRRSGWRIRQALAAGQPQVDVWLRADDPYSYLLAQVLPQLQSRFAVNWQLNICAELQDDMYPEPQMWQHNARLDARLLAALYGLEQPLPGDLSQPLAYAQIEVATARLLGLECSQPDWQQVLTVFDDLWQGKTFDAQPLTGDQQQQLQHNDQRLRQQGHYLSATLKFQGEWYWGLDRLDHLERRLNQLKLNRDAAEVQFDKTYAQFCRPFDEHQVSAAQREQPLILYFSIRSPYSHLGLERMVKLAQHYGLRLEIKPVLPMIMRGLKVPPTKKFYIFHDTKREADKLGIPYGFVADPLGLGVERCYALFEYARQQGRATDYLLSYARGVNAEGILSETDAGLKYIVERAGLQWSQAQTILEQPDWQTAWHDWAEANREEMIAQGQWGVPSLRYGELTLWGQDRIEFIEQAIRRHLGLAD
jgi:2-hydroxychromene-2-carboxylate isomerase